MSGYDSVNRNVLSRVRKVARDDADVTLGGWQFHTGCQQPKMLGCCIMTVENNTIQGLFLQQFKARIHNLSLYLTLKSKQFFCTSTKHFSSCRKPL